MSELIALALKNKYRYPSSKGQVTTEDLFDLPLTSNKGPSLQSTAQIIYQNINNNGQPSFISSVSASSNVEDTNKLEIVKFVIESRERDNAASLKAAGNKKLKEQLLGILADKESEAWKSLSPDKLKEMIASLN